MLQNPKLGAQARMDKNKMKMKALLLANVKMAGGCKGQGKTQVKEIKNADRN